MKLLRLVALVVGMFAVQLTLVRDATACGLAPAQSEGSANMATMGMPGTAASSSEASADQSADAGRTPSPCDAPTTLPGCRASMSCVTPFVVVVPTTRGHTAVPVRLPELETLTPVSIAVRPDVPPPRA
jgi:hypothetical protein